MQRNLADYEVAPLFDQFTKPAHRLPVERRREMAVEDLKGYMIEALKLRGRLTKLGYVRGPTGDGGWFFDYIKVFPSLRLKAVIEFSGHGLPEENRNVAPVGLHFQETAEEDAAGFEGGRNAPLLDIPAVLLSECYHDRKSVADEGFGFDSEWEKAVY